MRLRFAACLLLLSVFAVACGPAVAPRRFDLATIRAKNPVLTWDPSIKTGRLDNGLTYFVLPHRRPAQRAQLWLAVNAGSTQEDADQHGLAHFVEHMAFNGTRRFPKHDITDFVERSGSRIGPDVNATTSYDETVYKLQIPTDKPELVSKALMVLRDFADGVTFDPTEVEKERGVILEEWRLRRGAGARIADKHEAEAKNPSPYTTHKPIGNAETIKNAPSKTIERFYRDWYRPDLMAVIAVGDFDGADIEAKLRKEFSSIPATSPNARERVDLHLRYGDKTTVGIDVDAELSQVRVELDSLSPHRPVITASDWRRLTMETLWTNMLAGRLQELAHRPDAPFLSASTSWVHTIRPTDALRQTAMVRENGVDEGLAALYREVIRIDRDGFTKTELARAKATMLRDSIRFAAGADWRDSATLAGRLVSAFCNGETLRSPAQTLAFAKEVLPGIELEEVNKVSSQFAKGRHVGISGPPSMTPPTEALVRATLLGIVRSRIPPYDDTAVSAPLMTTTPAPGAVTGTTTIAELGVTEWRLKNGVRVAVKPTDLSSDAIRMIGFAPGGTSLASDADFESARFADDIVRISGVGALDDSALRRSLAGKHVAVNVGLDEHEQWLSGYSADDDLETMFQWVHLMFAPPRRDENAFKAWRDRQIASLKTKTLSPEAAFAEELAIFSTQNSPRRRPPTADSYQRIDLDRSLGYFRERFSDASNFTFVFVGNFDIAKLKNFTETYLGSLPSAGRKETWRDLGIVRPSGVQKKVVRRGTEPKSRVSLTFHGSETYSPSAALDMNILGEVLHLRLRDVLREEMGGVYTVEVNGSISRRPRGEYALTVSFGCAPENVDKLVKAVLNEAAQLREKSAEADFINRAREIRRRTRETATQDDAWWLKRIGDFYEYGEEPKQDDPRPKESAKVRLRSAARRYLDDRQYLLGILEPSK